MKEAIIICAVIIFVSGYFIMKKLDVFLEKDSRETSEYENQSKLYIAFENPMILEAITPILEKFSKINPNCKTEIFFAAEKEITDKIEKNEIDFGFINNNAFGDNDGYNSVRLLLSQGKLISESTNLTVKPLKKEKVNTYAIWNNNLKNICKAEFAELLKQSIQQS